MGLYLGGIGKAFFIINCPVAKLDLAMEERIWILRHYCIIDGFGEILINGIEFRDRWERYILGFPIYSGYRSLHRV